MCIAKIFRKTPVEVYSNLKESMKQNWNFHKKGELQTEKLSMREVWMFSVTTQCGVKFLVVRKQHDGLKPLTFIS